jgi:predicted amidohydrolase
MRCCLKTLLFFGSEQEKGAKAAEIETAARAFLKSTSAKHKITITGGGMPIANAGGKVFNSAVTYGPDGAELHRYDKLHLFDVTPGDNVSYQESRSTAPGGGSLSLFACGTMQVGMSVCYDIRFPALYRHHAKTGAQVLCVPAAFTRLTGEAHWHVLLRSRAIENTCYVLAAAQTGTHFGGRETFGHSMIVDPWGEVLGELNDRPGVLVHTNSRANASKRCAGACLRCSTTGCEITPENRVAAGSGENASAAPAARAGRQSALRRAELRSTMAQR